MDHSDFRALLHRYQQGSCTPVEKRLVEQWYARLGTERNLELTVEEETALVATVWQRITDQTGTAARKPVARPDVRARRRPWPVVEAKWAAIALLTLSTAAVGTYVSSGRAQWTAALWHSAPSHPQEPAHWQTYTNASAYETQVVLPDGSAVKLAPASTVRYQRTADGARRFAYLTGAASFDVFHDENHPFSVFTDKLVTTVLGTSFRIQAYAGQPEAQVQVLTGAVRVSPREVQGGSVVVLPNQQAVYSPARQQLRRELVPQPALLVPQSFVFNNRPVVDVLAALQQAYGVVIVHDTAALRNCTINLSLGKEPLFAKLDLLCETLGATYEKADGRILFHSQPCPAE